MPIYRFAHVSKGWPHYGEQLRRAQGRDTHYSMAESRFLSAESEIMSIISVYGTDYSKQDMDLTLDAPHDAHYWV